MEFMRRRASKITAAVPVALLVALAGNLSAAVADVRLSTNAVAAPAAATDIKPAQLKGALLTVDQLPEGYQSVPLGDQDSDLGSLIASHYDSSAIGSDPCAMMHQLPTGTAARLKLPAEVTGTTAGLGGITVASAAFIKGETGPLVLQVLADLGPAGSRAQVRNVERVLVRCPVLHADSIDLTMTPLWLPQLGDRSVAMTYTLKIAAENTTLNLSGQIVVVAYKNVSMVLATVAVGDDTTAAAAITTAQLRALLMPAMHNLRKANR
jgi:hypothetical protein